MKIQIFSNGIPEPQESPVKKEEARLNSGLFKEIREKSRLKKVLKQKQAERQEEFAKLRSLHPLGPEEQKILSLTWDEITSKLQSRELSATRVLESYIAKALEAVDKCNPITDFIPQAREWAKELDALPQVKGPLHGIPFVVKDDISVAGFDVTHGFTKRVYKPKSETASMVKVLMSLGAIPFARTNIPQTLFTYGSDNPVFGKTLNAHNPKLSPGGSSSGTGALVGFGGALFGTGTDIGGSLRIPAHFNGVSSIKPTNGRVSSKGFDCSLPNCIGVQVSLGIIGQNPSIVAAVSKYMLENEIQTKFDCQALPIQWDNATFESKKKLRIGYFTSLPFFPPMGDSQDIVFKAKEALESQGHEVVPFVMPDMYRAMKVFGKFTLADNGRHFKKEWVGEEVANCVKLLWIGSKLPPWLQRIVGRIMRSKVVPFVHSKRTGVMFGSGAQRSIDLMDATGEKQQILDEILDQWEELELDAVICNVMPFAAPSVDSPGLLPTAVPYCMIWNLVNFPAGVCTLGTESGEKLKDYDDEGDMALKIAKDNVKESAGAPLGIQVVAKPYKEEIILRIMKELEPFNTFNSKK